MPRHQVCSSCAVGKQHRASLHLESTNRILELIHVDLAGPMEVPSLGDSRYYMLLVDDFSRKLWVYFLTHKSDSLPNFQHWLLLMETQANSKVSTLRSDNGGEFNFLHQMAFFTRHLFPTFHNKMVWWKGRTAR